MPEGFHLPLLAAAVLVWFLLRALRQTRSERADAPAVVWRESTGFGWSDWSELADVAASTGLDVVLSAARDRAAATSSAVQFAIVAHPAGAPDYTLRVLYMSEVFDRYAPRLTLTESVG